jgi:hypothetical protein
LTSDPLDFEYKKYMILAFEQKKNNLLNENRLYPSFIEIINQYNYVRDFIDDIQKIEDSNKEINFIDWINKKLIYKSKIKDENIDEVKEIAKYGYDVLKRLADRYRLQYEIIESNIDISGEKMEVFSILDGYVVLTYDNQPTYYKYHIDKIYYSPDTSYVIEFSLCDEKKFYDRLNNNYFEITVLGTYPFESTLMPIIKRMFLKYYLDLL